MPFLRVLHVVGAMLFLIAAPSGYACAVELADMLFSESGCEQGGSKCPLVHRTGDFRIENVGQVANEQDLVAVERFRRLPELKGAVIETTLVNRSDHPVRFVPQCRIEWLFSLLNGPTDAGRYQPLQHRNDTWYGSTYWAGPDWTRVGKDWQHPGQQTPSVRCFTMPRDGHVTVRGRVYKADTNNGGADGVRVAIRHNRRTVWQAEIAGDDVQGVKPRVELDVRKNDVIRFVVHKRGTISYDTTRWDPEIAFDDGERFLASAGFSADISGAGWAYSLEVAAANDIAWPTVHHFSTELLVQSTRLAPRQTEQTPGSDGLPVWVIAGERDRDGIVVMIASRNTWRFDASYVEQKGFRIQLREMQQRPLVTLQPGEEWAFPPVVVAAYRGNWRSGMSALQRLVGSQNLADVTAPLRQTIGRAAQRVGVVALDPAAPELDLCAMVAEDWKLQDGLEETVEAYHKAATEQIEKAACLLGHLQETASDSCFARETREFVRLYRQLTVAPNDLASQRFLYARIHWLKRRIALKNPLMQFDQLFFCKRVPSSYSHLVMQYYGWRARPGGGLYVLEHPGRSLACRDILRDQLADGNVLEPRLSYDAKRIVFSFVRCPPEKVLDADKIQNDTDIGFYHVWSVNTDGTQLRQLTRGPFDDLMPTWLPDGGIALSSTRRKGYARCFGGQFSRRWHVYTIHRMQADGSQLKILSVHDTNEWFPTISNSGHLLYSRWDYIDRDAVTHQNLWSMRPDGTNPVAVWGNATSRPHCTFQPQPIPGSNKIVFTASAHHSITAGTIAVLDPSVGVDGLDAIERITPEVPFPEAEGRDIREYYSAPWPLSERYFLVAYSPWPLVWEPGANRRDALGIYLLDIDGNRELLYRDPEIGSTNPCPLAARPQPPVLPSELPSTRQEDGEMVLINVYEGLGDIERGKIKRLRIVQILPKTTHVANTPPVGIAREENARVVLGTVPVYPDGSARFRVPAHKPILFQALDEDGFAYQTMRTVTYVQPGERITCYGCHENRSSAPRQSLTTPIALNALPSRIDPGRFGGRAFSYMQLVQPVLDEHCAKCHGLDRSEGDVDLRGIPDRGFAKSYWSLCGDVDFWAAGTNVKNADQAWVPRFGGRNQIQVTPPGGQFGARGSRLLKMLRAGHENVRLDAEELRRLAMWIDCNAVFYGVYAAETQAKQLRGENVTIPEIQ